MLTNSTTQSFTTVLKLRKKERKKKSYIHTYTRLKNNDYDQLPWTATPAGTLTISTFAFQLNEVEKG